jgi:hypothetical protein
LRRWRLGILGAWRATKISLLTELESIASFVLTDVNDDASKISQADHFAARFVRDIIRMQHRLIHGNHR